MGALLSIFVSGFVFALGLGVSGMTDADKVIGFLNLGGDWDPSLAYVMGGALLVTLVGYRLVLKRSGPLFADTFRLPTRSDIDARLIGGAALFGIGWGLAGLCPGPALAGLAFGGSAMAVFVVAMLVPMIILRRTGL